jgi:two-component system, OmpR family, response regulator
MRILVVEDDAEAATAMVRGLTEAGHEPTHAVDGAFGLLEAQKGGYDVYVVDRMMPRLDGIGMVETLRKDGDQTPVLFLSALGEVDDRVAGLKAGADDYLVKPFATVELVARIRALARRHAPAPAQLGLGQLLLDSATRRARVGERALELSAREWAVLEYLLQQAGRVVSKQQIIDTIAPWGEDLTLNAVEVYVSRLRLKLDGAGLSLRTIRGFGYLLEAAAAA